MYIRSGRRHPASEIIDFTSSLYLGMTHASDRLGPWTRLTTGVPAAMREAVGNRVSARAVARLQGLDDGILFPSTLHLFWDFFEFLRPQRPVIYFDNRTYPIVKWGIERAIAQGIPVYAFKHLDADAFWKTIRRRPPGYQRPVVVTDSWCSNCGRAAPIAKYLEILHAYNGLLVIDDTQSLGILGAQPTAEMPYGYGGGGILPWLGIRSKNVVTGTSLAKGFGVPAAVFSGAKVVVRAFQKHSETRVNCSPPSTAVLHAIRHALQLNELQGDVIRRKLWQKVNFFRKELSSMKLAPAGSCFPVQTIGHSNHQLMLERYHHLRKAGIITVPVRQHRDRKLALSFLLNTDHSWEDLRLTLAQL